jgi:hypothetical protein
MFLRIILAFVVSVLQQGALPTARDVQAALIRGESLYFEARFADSSGYCGLWTLRFKRRRTG